MQYAPEAVLGALSWLAGKGGMRRRSCSRSIQGAARSQSGCGTAVPLGYLRRISNSASAPLNQTIYASLLLLDGGDVSVMLTFISGWQARYYRIKITCSDRFRANRWKQCAATNQIGGLLGDHDDWGIDVTADQVRHDRGVDHA
jgi:hypothetical protein